VELVDWDQLKLTLDEARAIAGERQELVEAEVMLLHERSGGWAAGLTLMLEGRRRNGNASVDLPEGRDAIFDYFAAQIFARVPEATQRFLVATALLPQVHVSIARELTHNEDAEAILEDLYRRHLFTHRRSGTEFVYWYHALFRAFLKARARAVLGVESTQELLSRAARLLEASGAFDDAFELFREAADWPAAARLIERRASDLLAHGRGLTLREWIQHLPAAFLDSHPWLRYWLGTSLIPVSQQDARLNLEHAFGQFHGIGEPFGQALSAAGIIDAYVFEWADFRPVKRWVDVLDGLVDRLLLSASPASEQRILSSLLLAMLYVAPGHPRLPWCVSRVTEMLDEELEVGSKLEAAMMLLAYCNLTSDMDRAAIAVARGNALAEHAAVTPFSRLWWKLRLALQLTLQGRNDESMSTLDEAEAIARIHGFQHMPTTMSLLWTYRAIATSTQGDVRATWQSCEHILAAASSGRPMAMYNATHARLYGECAAANDEAFAVLGIACIAAARVTGMVYLEALALSFHAIGLAITRQRSALRDCLARLREVVRDTCIAHFEVDIAMIAAWDMLRHEDRTRGLEMLCAALAQARGSRWKPGNTFRASRLYRELLAEACDQGIEIEYANDLIRPYRLAPPACATDRWPWPIKVYTLGRFEVVIDGTALQFAGKAPRKPLALLKAIVALGSAGVPAGALIDALWPDEEGDAARKSFDVTIARLRKLLGRNDAVVVSDEAVTLNPKLCWVDAQSFVTLADGANDGVEPTENLQRACRLYAGTFLPGDLEAHWTVKRRESLRSRFTRLVDDVGAAAEAQSAWEEAIAWYRRGLEADELAETFHQGLMRCYGALGRHAEGMSAYRRLRQTLSVTLGMAPSEQSQALAKSLQSEGMTRGISA
jgi:LuxR family maltose regulon positive regulatory protein